MTARGFILGKFMPPHAGHLYLCETAARLVDELTVLVCSTDAEPIPGALRFQWMQTLLPQYRVVHLHRDVPQEPADHPDFWPIWRDIVREFHSEPIDRVFGSEEYVFRLADEVGAAPVLIDPDRAVFPVSGEAVRADPAANWAYVPGPVRPYFQKRVCLAGPESSGKTTLAQHLAVNYGGPPMPEYGRTYDVHYKQGKGWTVADLVNIAETHLAMRAALAPSAGPILIEDTDPLVTLVWAEFLLGTPPDAVRALVERDAPPDLYLLLSPEVPWHDDGVRYAGTDDIRRWFFTAIRKHLDALQRPYAVIGGGDWAARTAAAEQAIESAGGIAMD